MQTPRTFVRCLHRPFGADSEMAELLEYAIEPLLSGGL